MTTTRDIQTERVNDELDSLVRAGFLCGYYETDSVWHVDWGGKRHRYNLLQIRAWLEGAHAMGAW